MQLLTQLCQTDSGVAGESERLDYCVGSSKLLRSEHEHGDCAKGLLKFLLLLKSVHVFDHEFSQFDVVRVLAVGVVLAGEHGGCLEHVVLAVE